MDIFRSNPIQVTLKGDKYKGAPPLGVNWKITYGSDLGCHTKAFANLAIESTSHNTAWSGAICRKYLNYPYIHIDEKHNDIYKESLNEAIYEDVTRTLGTGTVFILSDRVTRETSESYKTPCISGLVRYWAELGWGIMGSPITSNANYHEVAAEKKPHLCQVYFCWRPEHFNKVVKGTEFSLNTESFISKEAFEEYFSTEKTKVDQYYNKTYVCMDALKPKELWRGVLDLFKNVVVRPKPPAEKQKEEKPAMVRATAAAQAPPPPPVQVAEVNPPPHPRDGIGLGINRQYDDQFVVNNAAPNQAAIAEARGVLRPARQNGAAIEPRPTGRRPPPGFPKSFAASTVKRATRAIRRSRARG